MSENKFLAKMRGEKAPKSLVEVKNDKFLTPFVGLPKSTDVSHGFQNDAESSVIVANAAKNWGLQKTGLGLLEDASNAVYTGGVNVAGQNAWINLSYTFPTSSDSTNSVVSVINSSSKWVLRLVGKDLFSQNETIGFELVVKIGSTNIANIECATTRQAGFFCKTFVVDFSDSADKLIKVNGGDKLTVQLFCKDETATACYYTGNSVLSLLERRIDADVVANEKTSFEDIVDGLKTKQDIATAINYDNITNCITEIPQDIKLELNNGTLTLKAGSKVYRPNGAGVFDSVPITDDLVMPSVAGTRQVVVYVLAGGTSLNWQTVGTLSSGTTDSLAGTEWHLWYDTSNNIINRYGDSGAFLSSGHCFPIALCTVTSGVITSIDQVFNGFGYIGSNVFTLPGVKGLYPNGRNNDGTLKNGIVECTTVQVSSVFTDTAQLCLFLRTDGRCQWYGRQNFYYNEETNTIHNSQNGVTLYAMDAGTFDVTSGVISNFNPKQAFHAVDYSDTEYMAHQAMPSDKFIDLTLGTSGTAYTAPADGYIKITKSATAAGQFMDIYTTVTGVGTTVTATGAQALRCFCPVAKGDRVTISYTAAGTTGTFRFVFANGAK